MSNGQDFVRERHFESLAAAVSNEFSNLSVGGGASYDVFTGATTADGTSGLVPAPQAGDNGKFLRGDGVWATVESGSSGGGADYVIGSKVSKVEGGFWQGTFNDAPVLKLRHGDYEYNFQHDNITYIGGASSVLETVTPDTYVLGTASVSSEGGIWYEITDNVPKLWFHSGNFNYGINYSTITYKGGTTNMVCYLPFDSAETADACGNSWTTYGSPTIIDDANSFSGKALSLNGSSYLTNNMIAPLIGSSPWAVDFWARYTRNAANQAAFGTYNANYGTTGGAANSWVSMVIAAGLPRMFFNDGEQWGTIQTDIDTRHHYAMTYDGVKARFFVDGVLSSERVWNISLGGIFCIGNTGAFNMPFWGTIDHFRIFKGNTIWTDNFTPPTASDYL